MPDELTPSAFTPHEGSTFSATAGDTTVPLLLEQVEVRPEQPGAPRTQPFSLWFTGPEDAPLPQGLYPVDHDGTGRVELFLCPRQPEPGGPPRYEAVFN